MAEIIWTEPALSSLEEIAEYIALENAPAAKALVRGIISKIDRLADHPYSGRVPPELPNFPYREIVSPPCRIFYKVEKEEVFIINVIRDERQLRAFMLDMP